MTAAQLVALEPRFNPLRFSPKLWLSADYGTYQESTLATPAVANNDPVGGWLDRSGNGNNALQATDTKRPLLILNAQNGKSGLLNDGSDDYLQTVATLDAATLTVFAVRKFTSAGSSDDSVVTSINANGWGLYKKTSDKIALGKVGVSEIVSTNAITINSTVLLSFIYDGANANFWTNGVANGTPAYAVTFSGASLYGLGGRAATNFLHGSMYETLVFNYVLTPSQRQQVEQYLNSRWAIY